MREAPAVVVLAVLGVAVMSTGGHARLFEVHLTTRHHTALWQTSPPVFTTSSTWAGPGISLALGILAFDTAVSVVDLHSFRLTSPPFFGVGVTVAPLRLGVFRPYLRGSIVFTPERRGKVIGVGAGVTVELLGGHTETSTGLVLSTLRGAEESGVVLGFSVSVKVIVFRF